jgi:hypothetical protein
MAYHRNRAKVRGASGNVQKRVPEEQAWQMLRSGNYIQVTTDEELAQGHPLEIERIGRKRPDPSKARTITAGESKANAAAVRGKFTNDARIKVRNWSKIYRRENLRAVTVIAGRIFIPDPKAAQERASALAR